MLNIAICDDEIFFLQQIEELVREYLCSTTPGISVRLHSFQHGQELLTQVESAGGFDIYIMDIIMPGLDGIQTGKRLRELGDGGEIIYLTSSADYAIDSYDVRAFFYLLKPLDKERLFEVLSAAIKKLTERRKRSVHVSTQEGPRRIVMDQILYVELVGRCLRYYCSDGPVDSMSLRTSFHSATESLLNDRRFFQCGSSFAFNLQHVAGIKGHEVLLDNGRSVSIPRASVVPFKRAWGDFWLKEDQIWPL